jgi:hypothetical protein
MNARKVLELAIIYSIVALGVFLPIAVIGGGSFSAVDVKMYYQYAIGLIQHGVYGIEYPPAALAYMIVAYLLSAGNPAFYLPVHMLLMFGSFIASLIVAYAISVELFQDRRRAFLTGLMCAASPAAVYFTLLRYDPLPTLILMVSIYFFIKGSDVPAYIAAGVGALVKFFPAIVLPFYILYRPSRKGLFWFFAVVAAFTIPFIILNFDAFLYPFTYNFSRIAQAESIFYLLATITGTTIFSSVGSYILLVAIAIVIYMYYRSEKTIISTVGYITVAICMTVIFNRVASPQYFLWVTPLLAIYFSRNIKTALCFVALQVVTYIQYPILVDRIFNPTYYYNTDAGIVLFTIKYLLWVVIMVVLWKETHRDPSHQQPPR